MARKKQRDGITVPKQWFDVLWIVVVVGTLMLSLRAHMRDREFEQNRMVQATSKPGYLIQADIKR